MIAWAAVRLGLALALLGAAAEPAPAPGDSVRVGVLDVQVEGEVSERDRAMLEARFVDGLGRAGFEIVRVEKTCADAECVVAAAQEAAVGQIVRARIDKQGRDYELHAELLSGESGGAVVEESASCDICGVEDAADMAAGLAGRLRQRRDSVVAPTRLRIESTPPGAKVRLGERDVGQTPVDTTAEPGRYRLEVAKKGYFTERRDADIERGSLQTFSFAMSRQSRIPRWLGWTSIALGVATVAGGGVLLGLHDRPIDRKCNADASGECRLLHDTQAGGAALTVLGAVLIGTGIGLVIHRRRHTER